MTRRHVALRTRTVTEDGTAHVLSPRRAWDWARAAVVVCDMWDTTHCVTAARRVDEMAPRMNEVLHGLRVQDVLVVHAPDACMDFYAGTPARLRAMQAPFAPAPYRIDWHPWEPDEFAALPATLTDPGLCSCESPEPCNRAPFHGTRQTPLIDVAPEDVVTDDGQEFFNVLEERGVSDVLLMGVHLNICVFSRPYGIRQLVYWGKRPVLCRDLTDSFHRDPQGHVWGTEQVVTHIERRWCPSITSDQLVGGAPFCFATPGAPGRSAPAA
jgi:nicotinamidase-related amidase